MPAERRRRRRWHRPPRIRAAIPAVTAVLMLGLSSCGSTAYPGEPAVVDITMVDFSFQMGSTFPSGRVVLRIHNAGSMPHELVLVPLPVDFPNLNDQLHSSQRRALETLAIVPQRAPGADGTIAVDLTPGRYGIISFVQNPGGAIDALRGMNAEFRVQ